MGLQDIVLAVDRQFIETSAVGDGSFPAWHGDVLDREAIELEDARRVVVQLLTVLEIGILCIVICDRDFFIQFRSCV